MSAPYFQSGDYTVLHGDCIAEMRELADASVHAIVTDPPYGLGFMGKEWDDLPPGLDFAVEAFRVLKPGGHLLAFGGTRTWHRLAVVVEDAGFEIRDSIAWLYGSGFPKSLNVAKAIASGGGRPEDIRRMQMGADYTPSGRGRVNYDHGGGSAMNGKTDVDVELPDEARPWEGWGTALKPAFEPIVVARKPLIGTVAANVLRFGTGALNIDASRIPATDSQLAEKYASVQNAGTRENSIYGTDARDRAGAAPHDAGRFPANVILDESQAVALDEQSGTTASKSGGMSSRKSGGIMGTPDPHPLARTGHDDVGGASRFFPTFRYEAKAPTSERPVVDGVAHPTVKPLDLMRWLVRLVTPPGGTVLEPFAGSGTTVEACIREGFACIAIEREAAYLPLILARIQKDQQQSLLGNWDGAA